MSDITIKTESLSYAALTRPHHGLWGEEGQNRIQGAAVAIGGLGGVGSMAALELAKAGIGKIILCDEDTYQPSHLTEQIFATQDHIGQSKAEAASREITRHTPFTQVEIQPGSLSDVQTAAQLVQSADVVICGVESNDARNNLGFLCAKYEKPMVLSAHIGWGVFHTVYFPGENAYDSLWRQVEGIQWKDGIPDQSDGVLQSYARREWNMWVVIFAGFETEALREYVRTEGESDWYAAPQGYLAASQGVLDTLKIITQVGQPTVFPEIFCCNYKTNTILSLNELMLRRIQLQTVWDKGPDAIVNTVLSWG